MFKNKYSLFLCVATIALYSSSCLAQLSSNPWATENDEEAIEEVYNRRQRRGGYKAPTNYQHEENVVIDRTHAYIQEEDLEEDKGFVEKFKDAFSGKKAEEKPLIANTADNRKAVVKKKAQERAQKQAEEESEKSGGFLTSFGLGGMKMPSLDATSLIKKFERASGVNLKSIGKQFK
jgi:hypothetical protein